jgi:hypothetical protein
MEMTGYISHPRDLILPFVIALVFSTIGWLGTPGHSPPFLETVPTLGILVAFFAVPGGLVAAIAAGGFSIHGFHGVDEFSWVILPANMLIYFCAFTLASLIRRQRLRAQRP